MIESGDGGTALNSSEESKVMKSSAEFGSKIHQDIMLLCNVLKQSEEYRQAFFGELERRLAHPKGGSSDE